MVTTANRRAARHPVRVVKSQPPVAALIVARLKDAGRGYRRIASSGGMRCGFMFQAGEAIVAPWRDVQWAFVGVTERLSREPVRFPPLGGSGR